MAHLTLKSHLIKEELLWHALSPSYSCRYRGRYYSIILKEPSRRKGISMTRERYFMLVACAERTIHKQQSVKNNINI
ncbi:XXYS1_4_G0020360.mRNA.1.CDS.1 [Saccharomyces cerevisiae]|nr:XXYS1_4_G0020360.mRNA.1.CDS.1 [Saccharomyces cerevisiae]